MNTLAIPSNTSKMTAALLLLLVVGSLSTASAVRAPYPMNYKARLDATGIAPAGTYDYEKDYVVTGTSDVYGQWPGKEVLGTTPVPSQLRFRFDRQVGENFDFNSFVLRRAGGKPPARTVVGFSNGEFIGQDTSDATGIISDSVTADFNTLAQVFACNPPPEWTGKYMAVTFFVKEGAYPSDLSWEFNEGTALNCDFCAQDEGLQTECRWGCVNGYQTGYCACEPGSGLEPQSYCYSCKPGFVETEPPCQTCRSQFVQDGVCNYTLADCTIDKCGGYGECDRTGKCACGSGRFGATCSLDAATCATTRCGGNGFCTGSLDGCNCNTGYEGADCSTAEDTSAAPHGAVPSFAMLVVSSLFVAMRQLYP